MLWSLPLVHLLTFQAHLAQATITQSNAQANLVPQISECGKTQVDNNGLQTVSIQSGDRCREFLVYLPQSYDKDTSSPLLLSFHGNNKDMAYQANLTRFADPEINPDMIAVFPQGTFPDPDCLPAHSKKSHERCWEGAPYCVHETLVSDKKFTTDLLSYMRENYNIDDSRIYASGKSIGSGFIDLLACSPDHGGAFAAFAMDAAAMYTEALYDESIPRTERKSCPKCPSSGRTRATPKCSPARSPLPVLELHGTVDPIAAYSGRYEHPNRCDDGPLPPVRSVLQSWALRNNCPGSPSDLPSPTIDEFRAEQDAFYTQYDCAGSEGVVVGYNLTGQGHVWFSTQPNEDYNFSKPNVELAKVDASVIMMDFFRNWTKP